MENFLKKVKDIYKKVNKFITKNVGAFVLGIIVVVLLIEFVCPFVNNFRYNGTWEFGDYELEVDGSDCELYYSGTSYSDIKCSTNNGMLYVENRDSDSYMIGQIIDGNLVIYDAWVMERD